MADKILASGFHPPRALSAAALRPVQGQGVALDVAEVREGDDHVLFDDQVLVRNPVDCLDNLGAALIPESLDDFAQFVDDDPEDTLVALQQILEVRNFQPQLLEFVDDLLALHRSQGAEAHLENRLGLALGKIEALLELGARGGCVRRGANQCDDLVQVVEGNHEAIEDMRPLFCPGKVIDRPADDHFLAELDEMAERFLDRKRLGPAVHEREQIDREGRLQGRQLVELVEDDVLGGVASQFDDDSHSLAIRFVAQIGNSLDTAVANEVGHPLEENRFVHLVRNFRNDDSHPPLGLFEARLRTKGQVTPTRREIISNAIGPAELGAGGEIRTGHLLEQVVEGAIRVLRLQHHRFAQFGEVVRGHIGRHPHRDPRGAVGEKIGEAGGQNHRLFHLAVEIRREIHGLSIDISKHFLGEQRESRFGVAIGGGGVSVDGAKITLAVDQRIAEGKVLGHANHGLVDRTITMGVIVLEDLANDAD